MLSKTVVSENIFNQINSKDRPELIKKGKLLHAGGEPLKNVGKCELVLHIDSFKVRKEVMVADINSKQQNYMQKL